MTRARRWVLPLALLCLVAAFSASDAAVTRTPYQKYIAKSCPAGNLCLMDFPTVQANFRFEITNVSCYVQAQSTPIFTEMDVIQLLTMNQDASVASALTLVPVRVGFRNPAVSFAANNTVAAFAFVTQHFRIYARSHTGQMVTLACSLGGERVQLS
jgi:hypothetical protein